MSLKDKQPLLWPFDAPRILCGPNFKFSESDLEYINNVIISDKMFRLIAQLNTRWEKYESTYHPESHIPLPGKIVISNKQFYWMLHVQDEIVVLFLEKFLDDPKCPNGVKYFLWLYIGEYLGQQKRQGYYNIYQQHRFLTERWMEICR